MPGPTIQALAVEQRQAELERERLSNKIGMADSRIDNHEKRCEEHYAGIRSDMAEMKDGLKDVVKKIDGVITAQAANAAVAAAAITNARPKWWHQLIGGAVIALIGWMASTIWSMEAEKVNSLQHQPAATVTVNPPQATAPPVSPATVPPPLDQTATP